MTKIEDGNHSLCPYWSQGNGQECRMTKGGLYIPMPDHIENFCRSHLYEKCTHYLRGYELLCKSAVEVGVLVDKSDRRRYPRVTGQYTLSLSRCNEAGQPQDIVEDKAITIDLSLGGMQISSRRKIPSEQIMAFTLGDDFYTPPVSGVGEVMWTETMPESQGFLTGLSFFILDGKMKDAIGKKIGLSLS